MSVPVNRDLAGLAPAMRRAVEAVVAEMTAGGFDPWVFECNRTAERQAWIYAQGRSRPGAIVTKAASHLQSWHGHGLAVDIISKAKHWGAKNAFWEALGRACRQHGLTWGGDWTRFPDRPHCQWGKCPPGPAAVDKTRTAEQGMEATWARYGAAL